MNIYETLKYLNIEYDEVKHKAVYTVEEALNENIPSLIVGIECKNLFLKNSKNNYYLILIEANKKANLKYLKGLLNTSRLIFASEKELYDLLKLEPGSVTPMGIINDINNKALLLIDKDLRDNKILVHPNVNTRTISIKYEDLVKFIEYEEHKYIEF